VTALLLALLVAAGPTQAAGEAGLDPAEAVTVARQEPPRRSPPPRAEDRDAAMLKELELLEELDLLENLELFGADAK
jgi:hypothetical protein